MRVPTVLILGLLAVCAVDGSVIPDQALTATLQSAWYNDEFIIAASNIKDKRKHSSSPIETLLALKYHAKTKMVLILDRRTKRVILENMDDSGRRSASHVNVDTVTVNTPLKSLIILIHQAQPNSRMDVYVDCIYEGSIPLKKTFRDIAEDDLEVFRDRKCRIKVYQSTTITEVLRREQCPDDSNNKKQPSRKPSIFDTGSTDESSVSDSDEKKSTDQPKKKDHSSHPDGKNKLPKSKNPHDSSDPQFGKPDKTDDDDYSDGPSSHSPKGHRPKRPHQSGPTKPDKSDTDDFDKPPEGSDESDGLDYPTGSRPPHSSSHPPHFPAAYRPTKHPSSKRPRPDKSNLHDPGKRPNGSNPYDSKKKPFPISDDSLESGSSSSFKRPSRSPYSGSPGQDGYDPNQTDMPDNSSDESSGKRKPRRGDIAIQSLDERVCQTEDRLVKALNELINATKQLWREMELNRMETQHLRHLIENCSACRIGE